MQSWTTARNCHQRALWHVPLAKHPLLRCAACRTVKRGSWKPKSCGKGLPATHCLLPGRDPWFFLGASGCISSKPLGSGCHRLYHCRAHRQHQQCMPDTRICPEFSENRCIDIATLEEPARLYVARSALPVQHVSRQHIASLVSMSCRLQSRSLVRTPPANSQTHNRLQCLPICTRANQQYDELNI
eukprot:1649719-Amphidinium_carterae.1